MAKRSPKPETPQLGRYLSRAEVADRLGVSTKTIDREVARGSLPRAVNVSRGRIGWPEQIVADAMAARGLSPARHPDKAVTLTPEQVGEMLPELVRRYLSHVEGRDIPADTPVFVSRPATAEEFAASGEDALRSIWETFAGLSFHNAVLVMLGLCPQYRREALPLANNAAALPPVDDDEQWFALALSLLPSR
jgi:predicted DNA-binding transcriptional regulator AlpA